MGPLRLAAALGALVFSSACYQPQSTYSTFPEPTTVAGPPGGEMDPPSAYPGYPDGYPAGYPDGYSESTEDIAAMQTEGARRPSADPAAAGYVMGTTNDQEIDATLSGYGEWIEVEGYGRVWRPDATVVGVDFTPYESCGTWVWTDDYGWTFGCDWDWGWLPFHYGRWGWFDDYWAWEPGYDWSPAWVEWRSGDDYCGWRPLQPTGTQTSSQGGWQIRDHRTNPGPWNVAGKATPKLFDSQWRFAARNDFGKRIRPNLFKNPAEGLRATTIATRPPMRGQRRPVSAASVMHDRLRLAANGSSRGPRAPRTGAPTLSGGRGFDAGGSRPPRSFERPLPARGLDPSPSPRNGSPPPRPERPAPTFTPPARTDWTQPSRSAPSRDSTPSREWSPPSHSTPSRSSEPSRSSGGNWSPPSRSSGSSSSSSGSSSSWGGSSGSSHSSGGSSSSRSSGGGSSSHSSGGGGSHSSGGGGGGRGGRR